MYKNKRILAIIPARGGSKRIPLKNIKPLNGKPLIYYTIKTVLGCKLVDRAIVSTDHKKIAAIAKKNGAEVPFLRPKKLSGDAVSDQAVVQHCLNFFKKEHNEEYDYILYLKPTAPLRTVQDINNAITTIHEHKLPLVRSVTGVTGTDHPYWMYSAQKHLLKPFIKTIDIKDYYRSQLLPQNTYALNGVVEIFTGKQALNSEFIYNSKRMGYIEIPKRRAIDIDDRFDFDLVRFLIKHKRT